jgi:hypothetical protein
MSKIIVMPKPFLLKPYTKKELCAVYNNISPYILNRWLDAIADQMGETVGKTFSIKQVEIFVKHYGTPGQFINEAA